MNRNIYNILWFFKTQLGLNPVPIFNSLKYFLRYIKDFIIFKKKFKGKIVIKPSLQDFKELSGKISEYTIQDLFVAQKIFLNNPKHHVDVGSRVDGFITNIATFMNVEIFDIRDLDSFNSSIKFKKLDIFSEIFPKNYTKSLSCLHTIEHFGLGRYGDQLMHDGLEKGLNKLSNLLKKGGLFYFSTPVGDERVEFNSNWIFDLNTIFEISKKNNLIVKEIYYLDEVFKKFRLVEKTSIDFDFFKKSSYKLIFIIFCKI